ncbi:unnamed protein product [Cunninghamella blakesleeana]
MSTIIICSENNKFESYMPSQTTKANKINDHHHYQKNKNKSLSLNKTSKKINKRISSPPIFISEQPLKQQQQHYQSSSSSSSSPQFYFYNHSDQLNSSFSPTFQSTIKSPTKRKRVYNNNKYQQTNQRRYSCPSFHLENTHDHKNLNELEDELAYTQETLATVNIMFDSLKQTFTDYEPHLKPNVTRLCEKEKELLSAYDDLELQVIHLKRHINKLESTWKQWKTTCKDNQLIPSPSHSTSSLS